MKRCLIVDDSSSTCKIFRRIAETMNFSAEEAMTHEDALAACGRAMPDCIVVDWNMPEGDGIGLLQEVRKMPEGKKPKVLYCTSENDPLVAVRAMRCGADLCFMKPFDRETLVRSFASAGLI